MERIHFVRNASGLVLVRVNHKGFKNGRFTFSTEQKVTSQNWDQGALKRDQPTRFIPTFHKLRSYLEAIRTACEKHLVGEVNGEKLKRELLALRSAAPVRLEGFYSTWAHIIETTKIKGEPIRDSTKSAKRQSMNKCMEFAPDLTFSGVTIEFYHEYYSWLMEQTPRTVGKHIKELKAFMNECIERGIQVPMDFKKKSFIAPKSEGDEIYLTEEEIDKIEKANVPKSLESARDLFVLACYCGQRFGDWSQLVPENVEGNTIRVAQEKGRGKEVYIPIHPLVRKVWAKYEGLPAIMTNHELNLALKDIARAAKLGKWTNEKRESVDKWTKVVTHTARRSFATNAYLAGVPILEIMKITGHANEKTFLRYIKAKDKQLVEKASKHSFFNPQMKVA